MMNVMTPVYYQFDPFAHLPVFCPMRYTYTSSDSSVTDLFMSLDSETQTFTFWSIIMDESHLGSYTITVKGENDSDPLEFATSTFVVMVI